MSRRRDHVRYAYRIDRGITIVTARGEIDAHNAHGLLHEAKCRNADGERALLLDLTGLRFLSTHGLRTLWPSTDSATAQHCPGSSFPAPQ